MFDRIDELIAECVQSFTLAVRGLLKGAERRAIFLIIFAAVVIFVTAALLMLLAAVAVALAETLGTAAALATVGGGVLVVSIAAGVVIWNRINEPSPEEKAAAAIADAAVPAGTPVPPAVGPASGSEPSMKNTTDTSKNGEGHKGESFLDPGVLAAASAAIAIIVGPARVLRAAAAASDAVRVAGALAGSLDVLALVQTVTSAMGKVSAATSRKTEVREETPSSQV